MIFPQANLGNYASTVCNYRPLLARTFTACFNESSVSSFLSETFKPLLIWSWCLYYYQRRINKDEQNSPEQQDIRVSVSVLLKSACVWAYRCFNTECKCQLRSAALKKCQSLVFNFIHFCLCLYKRWPWLSLRGWRRRTTVRLPWKLRASEAQRCNQMWQRRICSVCSSCLWFLSLFVKQIEK